MARLIRGFDTTTSEGGEVDEAVVEEDEVEEVEVAEAAEEVMA